MPSCERGGRRSGGGVQARRPAKRWRQAGERAAADEAEWSGGGVTLPASAGVVAARATFSTHTHRSEWAAAVKPTPSAVAKPIPRERKEGEKQRKREGADMVSMTCGAHVGPTLSQPPRGIKSGSKPPRDLLPLLATPVAPALRIRASQSSVNNKAPAIVERKR
uniref:Uncharacterized protein n=1 Tax=Oryza meridionalis TaxID=40149 RepID=A0A0E0F7J9_9ORYZ